MQILKIFSIFILLVTNLQSQFVNAKITINKDRLQKSINNELDNFEINLENLKVALVITATSNFLNLSLILCSTNGLTPLHFP